MLHEVITYRPQPDIYPLYITAKRYWLPEFTAHSNDPDSLTLVVLHSTSFHKETWEPSLERLFWEACLNKDSSVNPVKIREAWAIDCPNHGQSGPLNERVLMQPEYANDFSCEKYAEAVHRFLSGGLDQGARVDFRQRNLVGIGHSLGSNAILLLQHIYPLINFASLLIVEPMLSSIGPQALGGLRNYLIDSAIRRNDTWSDRATALRSLKQKKRTGKWDPRVLELFVKYAIRPSPGASSVTLACTRQQEIVMYKDEAGPTKPVQALTHACSRIPVHLILGAINDFIPAKVHQALTDPALRNFASITTIEGTGHLIPQEVPNQLGSAMYNALAQTCLRPPASKM